MTFEAVNLAEKAALFSDHWSPRIIAQMNDCHLKLVKMQGDFVWHTHEETDEVFIVFDGEMTIDFQDGAVHMKAGELFVVPRGKEHKPRSEQECTLVLIEPAGTINTGDTGGEKTAPDDIWI